MSHITADTLRTRLIALRDELLELNTQANQLQDNGQLPDTDTLALYEAYTQISSVVSTLPYNNPIAKILSR